MSERREELSVLIPTTDHYHQTWEGLALSWELLSGVASPIYLVSDFELASPIAENMRCLSLQKANYTKQDFSNKLILGLEQISSKYVLLICDDMWPTHSIAHLIPQWVEFCERYAVDSFRIHEKLGWWDYDLDPTPHFIDGRPVLRMKKSSSWLLSHNACIWRSDFLRQVIIEDEDPWTNEFEGTKRIAYLPHSIYHYNYRWYHQSYNFSRGKITSFGKALVANLLDLKEFTEDFSEKNRRLTQELQNEQK